MNWDEVEGLWKQIKGTRREKWGKLTEDDIHDIGGKKDRLIGKLQQRYGQSREQAEPDADACLSASQQPSSATGPKSLKGGM